MTAILHSIFLTCFVAGAGIRYWFLRGFRRQRPALDIELSLLVLVGVGMQVLPLVYIFTTWLDFADYARLLGGGIPLSVELTTGAFGVGIFLLALTVLYRCHADLAENWTPGINLVEGHKLVTHGIYGHVRHPMYTAHILWAIAQALLLHNWIAGPAMLLPIVPLFMFRIPREEAVLIKEYGDEYRRYMERTGRLIPH